MRENKIFINDNLYIDQLIKVERDAEFDEDGVCFIYFIRHVFANVKSTV